MMIRYLPLKQAFFLLPVFIVLSACSLPQWPLFDDRPRVSNRPQSSPAFVNASAVIVAKGDTVYGLSRRHRVSVRAIIEANRLRAPFVLMPGQRLILPRAQQYIVKRGDSLSVIAQKYDVDMYALARLNGLRPPYLITIDQRLLLPDGSTVASAQTPPARGRTLTSKPRSAQKTVTPPPARAGKVFLWPVKGKIVSTYGGKTKGLRNDGINIAAPLGAQVVAAENGVVAYAGNELRGFGNLLLLKHADGWITAYAHNQTLLVKRGDKIKKGQVIAKVGSSGSVRVPQLHFELRKGKRAINPIKYLPRV